MVSIVSRNTHKEIKMAWNYTKNGNISKIQYCNECGVRVQPMITIEDEPLWNGTLDKRKYRANKPDNWFWQVCEGHMAHWIQGSTGCLEIVCSDCSEMVYENPEDGNSDCERICNSCLLENAQNDILRGETK